MRKLFLSVFTVVSLLLPTWMSVSSDDRAKTGQPSVKEYAKNTDHDAASEQGSSKLQPQTTGTLVWNNGDHNNVYLDAYSDNLPCFFNIIERTADDVVLSSTTNIACVTVRMYYDNFCVGLNRAYLEIYLDNGTGNFPQNTPMQTFGPAASPTLLGTIGFLQIYEYTFNTPGLTFNAGQKYWISPYIDGDDGRFATSNPVHGPLQTGAYKDNYDYFNWTRSEIAFEAPYNFAFKVYAASGGGGGGATLEHQRIYVADTNNNRIQRYDTTSNSWAVVAGGFGAGVGSFNKPQAVAVGQGLSAATDVIFVADTSNNRIQRGMNGGSSWEVISQGFGVCNGCFNQPRGIAYDEVSKTLYVVDTGNNRIMRLANADTVSATTAQTAWTLLVGGLGTTLGKFNQPVGIAVDSASPANVYVTDTGNHRIQKCNTTGTITCNLYGSTSFGAGLGMVNSPRGIFVDSSNRVWIADTGNNRVQQCNLSGSSCTVFMPVGAVAGSVQGPQGVTVGSDSNVYVSDATSRIQRRPVSGGTATVIGTVGTLPGSFQSPGGLR
ncbi:MAG: NHL repeat-containing protein [Acidobacteriota bacterium]|nr:NHL repeat-containing protein [Blastocatellia bacterium]MDW8411146.1 NHL repeat-containing protein [Acidobacteriota bacterium]